MKRLSTEAILTSQEPEPLPPVSMPRNLGRVCPASSSSGLEWNPLNADLLITNQFRAP